MREGLRSSTVSQRKIDRSDSGSDAKPVTDVGLVGDCIRVRNLLPDLNTEANPSEFDSDWPYESGYAGDELKGEAGRSVGAEMIDINMEYMPCGEEEMELEKEKVGGFDEILQQNLVLNQGCDVEVVACSGEPKMDLNSIGYGDGDESFDLQSKPGLLGFCSENVACSIDTLESPDKDKMQVGVRVLRSRVVGSGWGSENVTSSMVSQKTISPETDKLQVGGKVLRSRVVVGITTEVHSAGSNRRKRATGCQVNEIEAGNGERNENVDGQNKKHKGILETPIEEEDILLKSVLQGEEAFAEERKNDESNEFFDCQNNWDTECCESLRKEEEKDDLLNNMTDKDETAAEVLSNDISKQLAVDSNKKGKVGRGRPRKQHVNNVSIDLLLKKEEEKDYLLDSMTGKDETAAEVRSNDISTELAVDPNKKCKVGRGRPRKHDNNVSVGLLLKNTENLLEDGVKIKQVENVELTDRTEKQQQGGPGKLKKRKRGRPRKTDTEIDGKAGEGSKKQGIRKFVKGAKNLSGKKQKTDHLNLVLHSEGGDATNNIFSLGGLMKRKPGRPRKINKENDTPEPIPEDQEGTHKAVVVMVTEDAHRIAEGSMKRVKKQTLKDPQAELKTSSSGTASLSSSRSKRKRKKVNTEEASKVESNLSCKVNLKVKNSSTREEKNIVRQQIVEMLKSAGWTVEYKPRQGKDYADSIYRCPEGKTHWSVTLAYRMLKQQVETGKAADFCFTPIPEEKLSKLFRVQVKARSDKNKPKLKSGEGKVDNSGGKEKTAESLSKRKQASVRNGKQNRRRCALLVRGSGKGLNSAAEEFVAVSGKHSILSWMIKCGVIPPGGKVYYRRRTKVLLEGSITKDGIHCSCCSKLHSVAQFESHAGNRSCPLYQNLYLDNGSSLLQCQMELWNKQEESIRLGFHRVNVDDNDPNDDTCGICGDGGNLICCDGCPSTFHQACLNILKFPSGDWHCVYCSCKYCGTADGGLDQDSEKHDKSPSLLNCCLCDGKYHRLCAYENESEYVQSSGSDFCGKSCEQIYERLQRLVGVRMEVGDGYTCTLIKRPESTDITPRSDALEEPNEIENMSKLAVAFSVMNECFLPIVDHRSGITLMRHTLYSCGSNFKRLNFRSFFTAILEKEDEVIAAASIRIHGKELAEMPFIGTRNSYRRQGMCRRLLSGIESALRSLAIEKLVIPAVSEVTETWTSVFNFEPLGGLGNEMRHMNVLVFPGVDMLQKPLLNQPFADQEEEVIQPGDCCSKKHADKNGLIDTKAEDGCTSEKYEPSIEARQDSEKLSSENGNPVLLESAAVDQEEGNISGKVFSDADHSTEIIDQSNPPNNEGFSDGASDHVVTNLNLAEPTGKTVCEGGRDDTALNGPDGVANMPDNACSDHNLVDVTVQPNSSASINAAADPSSNSLCSADLLNSSTNSPKLENEVLNPLENGAADFSSTPLCNGDLPNSSTSSPKPEVEVLNPLENGAADFFSTPLCNGDLTISVKNADNPVEDMHDSKEQSLATEENLLLVKDHSILNEQMTDKTTENFESHLQIDCNVVPQFNLEKSCNMDSGSNDLATPVTFHACSAPEV